MNNGPNVAIVGALIGDPARAAILTSLMSGQALTANELARSARVGASTASGHLAQLLHGGLLDVEKQGRHRYYRLAGPDVAAAIEALMHLAEQSSHRPVRRGPKDPDMRKARVCYDHLAGERGVELFVRLTDAKIIALESGSVRITAQGEDRLLAFGIDIVLLKQSKRLICRTCIDWSERCPHLAGTLGARLLDRIFELKWVSRVEGSRVVQFSAKGETNFATLFRTAITK